MHRCTLPLIVKFPCIRRLLGRNVSNKPTCANFLYRCRTVRSFPCRISELLICRFLSSCLVKQRYSLASRCSERKKFSKRLKENGKQIVTVQCITPPVMKYAKIEIEDEILFVQTDAQEDEKKGRRREREREDTREEEPRYEWGHCFPRKCFGIPDESKKERGRVCTTL